MAMSQTGNRFSDEGWDAYFNGVLIDDCPYTVGSSGRTDWMIGWLDARTHRKYDMRQHVRF